MGFESQFLETQPRARDNLPGGRWIIPLAFPSTQSVWRRHVQGWRRSPPVRWPGSLEGSAESMGVKANWAVVVRALAYLLQRQTGRGRNSRSGRFSASASLKALWPQFLKGQAPREGTGRRGSPGHGGGQVEACQAGLQPRPGGWGL